MSKVDTLNWFGDAVMNSDPAADEWAYSVTTYLIPKYNYYDT